MIRSMTAFARAEVQGEYGHISCELRSVNQRFLEPNFRLPEALRDGEFQFREKLRETVTRGKMDIIFRYEPAQSESALQNIDAGTARAYIEAAKVIQGQLSEAQAINPVDILRLPGVMKSTEVDSAQLIAAANAALNQALKGFLEMREREGAALLTILRERLANIRAETDKVRIRIPAILEHYRSKLAARLAELSADSGHSHERLEQELVLWAQKIDVTEELDRLTAHIGEVERVLVQGGAVGRRLDFLMQELNREANTLGAKSVSADTSWSSVELKVTIEQMREQIQNIE